MPASEKILRFSKYSLSGKALVKDLGFTISGYERGKEKLDRKYGGDRRVQIKHLASVCYWP